MEQTEQTPKKKSLSKSGKVLGRPTVMTDNVLNKLRQAFSYGCTDNEACVVAGISQETFYNYLKVDKSFLQERDELRLRPIISARQMIVKNIPNDLAHARWYATKKLSQEFGDKMNIEHTVVHKVNLDLSDPAVRETLSRLDDFARQKLIQPKQDETISESQEPMGLE